MLHIAGLTAVLDLAMSSPESPPSDLTRCELLEHIFTCSIDLAHRCNEYRKSKSIPNAVPVHNGLFSKEDLAFARQAHAKSQ